MRIGAIIVSQDERLILRALRTIREEADYVVAIENIHDSEFAVAATVINDVPLSFAENINKGWRMLKDKCDAIVIANADIGLEKGWRKPLETALEEHADYGAVSLPIDVPQRLPGVSKMCPFVFTLVRVAAVTWADAPADEDFVNYGTDLSMSYDLHRAGWLHAYVEGPMVQHFTHTGDKRSFKSGALLARDPGAIARKGIELMEFNGQE